MREDILWPIILAIVFCSVIGAFAFLLYTVDSNRLTVKMACVEAMKANPAVDCKEIVK